MTPPAEDGTWKHCNICKSPIAFQAEYFVCSVSTCNRKRTGLLFCSLPCFEAHLPTARHRDAWAEREQAPSASEWRATLAAEASTAAGAAPAAPAASSGGAAARSAEPRSAPPAPTPEGPTDEHEILVVVSKLKKYVRDWSGMNTSDAAMNVISDHLRELCREATRHAGADGRRTVLDRDFAKVVAERRGPDVKRRF
ncbi:MAG TPA: hypothetical protein VMG12_12240 [Polyangiaceae bacterium]|nr:hypothetical protein [Polyangiaceae bacterium]